ncbi:hypothetical protein [Bacillus massilinigeriensis]|uniref:hypothetical protein n=1 Tax=Bacillus mediterraneensis TaxID=1805474 RepID=UPI0008F92088|nr:hypothetical protein [Bacillus mediterraneensis]
MRKYSFLILIFMLLLVGCNDKKNVNSENKSANNKEVTEEKMSNFEKQQAIIHFINKDLSKLNEYEQEAKLAFLSVTGENFTNDQEVYDALNEEIIPKYKKAVDEAENLDVKMKELKPIKEELELATSYFYESMVMKRKAVEQQDRQLAEDSDKKLLEHNDTIMQYHKDLETLAKKYNVKYEPATLK